MPDRTQIAESAAPLRAILSLALVSLTLTSVRAEAQTYASAGNCIAVRFNVLVNFAQAQSYAQSNIGYDLASIDR